MVLSEPGTGTRAESLRIEDEQRRLAAVHRYEILDAPADGSFDGIAIAAAKALKTPLATVTIVDEDRVWLTGRSGVEADEVTRGPGLCASAILTDELTILSDARLDPEALNNPLVRGEFGLRFYAAAPIITRDGYRLGTVNAMDTEPRAVSEEEAEILRSLAGVVADQLELRLLARRTVHLERQQVDLARKDGRRAERETEILFKRLLPPRLPDIPEVELASHYRPAVEGRLAGDFYEVFAAGDGRWGLILGDVMGKGIEAGALAALARNSLRTALVAGHSCEEALAILNRVMLLSDQPVEKVRFCSAVCATLEPTGSEVALTVANGGHPRPLIIRNDGMVTHLSVDGILVGCFDDAEFTSHQTLLSQGDAAVFYTDGISEIRLGEDMFGEEGIERLLANATGSSAEEIVHGLIGDLARIDTEPHDDVALLAVSVRSS